MTRRRRSMPSGNWRPYDELLPGNRVKCVCGVVLKRGGGVRRCSECGRRLWVHAAIIVEVEDK